MTDPQKLQALADKLEENVLKVANRQMPPKNFPLEPICEAIDILKELAKQSDPVTVYRTSAMGKTEISDTVSAYGIKDGKEVYLGEVPTPPRMKARDLVRETFGRFEDEDGSDADLCMGVCDQLINYMTGTKS